MRARFAGLWVVATAAVVFLGFGYGRPSRQPEEIPYDAVAASNHIIPIGDGVAYTRNFRQVRDALQVQHPELKGRLSIPDSESFNRAAMAVLLDARDSGGTPAAGVRIYFGLDAVRQTRLVLVPYDSRGNDIVTRLSAAGASPASEVTVGTSEWTITGEVVEDGIRCPPNCPPEDPPSVLAASGSAKRLDAIHPEAAAARNHFIPIQEGVAYTRGFRKVRDALQVQHAGLKERLSIPDSESFNRDAIAVLLDARDPGGQLATGVRIYFGLDAAGQTRLVLVPYDSRGNDIITRLSTGTAATSTNGEVVEDGQRCPPICASDEPPSVLGANGSAN